MVFTIEKFIEILKDPKCISFEWEVEGCNIAFYREWVAYFEDKKSYNSVNSIKQVIDFIPTKIQDCKIKIEGKKITIIPNSK